MRRVLACRTPALGGRLYRCDGCSKPHFAYHSCNHRSCPQCGAREQQEWTAKQEAKLLPVPYFMVTFTVPAELRQACLARYVKRSAIGPKRIIGYDKHRNIRLHWTSSSTKQPGILTLLREIAPIRSLRAPPHRKR